MHAKARKNTTAVPDDRVAPRIFLKLGDLFQPTLHGRCHVSGLVEIRIVLE
jgi:hypothetical protein